MPVSNDYRIVLGEAPKAEPRPRKSERKVERAKAGKVIMSAAAAVRALKASAGAEQLIARIPALASARFWGPVASFTPCRKSGTAAFLDIWDADHFDGFTDVGRNLAECRVWFSAAGFAYWDSPETRTGRVNCYFKAPSAGNYVCVAYLLSYAGPAQVECLIDAFSYGPLPFTGTIVQPHPAALATGYHSFRIRQLSGSFFFQGLTVWRV